ncbi:MAG: FG-GAP-like repeat-containing protein [Bacteroidota bacterium]|nr:FG-GAP-like repeat-containing protein [Bacteroidota bacterium]
MKKVLSIVFLAVAALLSGNVQAQAPTVAASSVVTVGTGTSTISLNWTNGNGSKRIVTCALASSGASLPVTGGTYTGSTTFGSGSNLGSSNYCVYNGTAAGLTIFGLSAGTQYKVRIFEFNTVLSTEYYLTSGYPIHSEYTLATAPTTASSSLNVSSITASTASLTFTSGNGAYDLVALRAANTYANLPVDGTYYSPSFSYGSGATISGTTPYPYVLSGGTSTTVNTSALAAGTTYTAAVFPYNGSSSTANYYTSGYPTKIFTTLAAQPNSPSSSLAFSNITDNSMTVSWTTSSSAGVYRIVTCKAGTTNTDLPVDATYYTPGSVYGTGSLVGTAYTVYNGFGNFVNVTGLSNTTDYAFTVYEYNVASNTYNNTYNYLTTGLSGFQQTLTNEPTTAPSALSFSNITNNSVRATWANGNGARRIVGVAAGRKQTGVAFDGVNDYINLPSESTFDFTTNMTVEAWIKVNSFSVANQAVITKGNESWRITRAGTTNALQFSIITSVFGFPLEYSATGTRSVNDGEWHHVAATYNGSQVILYIDGTLDVYTSCTYNIDNNTFPVQIGSNAELSGLNFNGQIDEVRIWNVAQPNTTIKNNMNKSLVGSETGLLAYYKLDDGFTSTTLAKNSSLVTGMDATLINAVSTAASSFTGTSGWIHSGARVNVPLDFTTYVDNPAFMSTSGTSQYYGNLYFTVYRGPDSTTVNATNLSPSSYYTFGVFDYNGVTGNNNYLTDLYALGEVQTLAATAPTITSFTPASGTIGTLVTLNGTGFNPTAATNTVYFGATKAVVISANAGGTQLVVQVPMGATYEAISVVNNTLSAFSSKPFVVTSACLGTAFSAATLNPATTLSTSWYPADQSLADIDVDGKPDLVSLFTGYVISVARNTSTTTAISFASPFSNSVSYTAMTDLATADLDGDGRIDMLLNNRNGSLTTIIAYRNNSSVSSISFAPVVEFAANPATSITDVSIADFDKDGKPDVVVSYNNNMVSFFRNISSSGSINFAPRTDISIGASAVINSIAVADFDGDGKSDVAISGGSGNSISYLRNTSTSGNITFAAVTSTAMGSSTDGIAAGDMDGDGKTDLVTGYGTSSVAFLRSTSSSGSITFSGSIVYATAIGNTVTDVTLADIDGDGKVDAAAGYSTGTSISLFRNTSTVGSIVITPKVDYASTGSTPAMISLGDLNSDTKSDVISSTSGIAYSVFQNNIDPLAAEPTLPASGLSYTAISTTGMTVNFSPGNGANKAVFVRLASTSGLIPVDGVNYVPNTTYGSGTDIGGGNYCVFNGNGSTVTVTGLASNTSYTFSVYEYNGSSVCDYNYMSNSTSNSGTQATNNAQPVLNTISNPASVCESSGLQTVSLSGIGTGSVTEVQTLTITASSSNIGLIPTPVVSYTSPSATGSVSYTPVAGVSGTSIITVTVNDGATNNNTILRTFTVTIDRTPTVSAAGPNQQICPNVASMSANTPVFGTGVWTFNYTSNPSITITNVNDPNTTVNNFNIGDSVRLRWTISNGACAASGNFVTVKRKNCPTTADFTTSSSSECLTGTPVVTYTDASVASGGTIIAWSWNFGAGAFPATATGIGPHTVSYSTAGAKTVSLQVTDNLATNDTEIKTGFVDINNVPDPSGNISGTGTVCQGQTGVTYSVPTIPGATGYTWSLPTGATMISGVNTNNVTIDFGTTANSGNMTVKGNNLCGDGTVSANFAIIVNPLPIAAGTIIGSSSVCDGASGVTYSVPSILNATGYSWSVPGGAIIMSGAGTSSITVNYIAGSAGGPVSVYGTNTCGNGLASLLNVTINPYPQAADVISGMTMITACPSMSGVTYSIPLVLDATSYNWTVPSGVNIVSGAGTNVITVDYTIAAVSGSVAVTPVNSCGNGSPSSLSVTVNTLPDMAGILSGMDSLTVCPASLGVVYNVSPVFNATYYVWTLPSGASIVGGDSTNSIIVDFAETAPSGNITVYGENACGTGSASSLFVFLPAVPTQELCLVTVDDNSQYNKVVWEKPVTTEIDSFRIYREVLSSFEHIASVSYDSLSEYVDSSYLPLADPNTTNHRYKIAVVDTCGNVSAISAHHRTVFLQANQGVGGVVNLSWIPYDGATVDYYRILRDTLGSGAFVVLDSVPGSNTVFTDLLPPVSVLNVSYVLESNWSTSCNSTRATISTTRSNIKNHALVTIGVTENNMMNNEIIIYPNPASEMFTLQYPAGFEKYNLQVFDALGQMVMQEQLSSDSQTGTLNKQFDVSHLNKGMYIVSVQTEYGSTFKRLVIQ